MMKSLLGGDRNAGEKNQEGPSHIFLKILNYSTFSKNMAGFVQKVMLLILLGICECVILPSDVSEAKRKGIGKCNIFIHL